MQRLKDKLEEKINLDNQNQQENIVNVASSRVSDEVSRRESNLIVLDKVNQDSVVPEFAITMNDVRQRIVALQKFISEIMIPDTDYGIIPGCKKPSLYKSGAEKLCDVFGFSKHIEVSSRVEDWENKIFHYEVKATLINKKSGLIEAEGIGCCNNRESKYSKQDAYSIINTILKMAKKRAIVDAVLSATRSSGLFTQDLEEIQKDTYLPYEDTEHLAPLNNNASPRQTNGTYSSYQNKSTVPQPNTKVPDVVSKPATKSQLNLIMKLVVEKCISLPEIKDLIENRYNVSESKQLSTKQASDLIKYISSEA